MEQIEEFVDERQKTWCIHCTRVLATLQTNRDHVPTKGLLKKPFPKNVPVIPVCADCNNGFSRDEEYLVTFLGCVLSGSTAPEAQVSLETADRLRRSPKLRTLIEQSRTEYTTLGGETRSVWKPDLARVNRVILKNARGHAFFEIGEPMLSQPSQICSQPLSAFSPTERDEFENLDTGSFYPEVGSRMLTRVVTGQDLYGTWVIVQNGVYRYSVTQAPIRVRSVIHEYLATEVFWED